MRQSELFFELEQSLVRRLVVALGLKLVLSFIGVLAVLVVPKTSVGLIRAIALLTGIFLAGVLLPIVIILLLTR